MVQMPSGVPVATVGINGAKNAALLAVSMLGIVDGGLRQRLKEFRKRQACAINERAEHLGEIGIRAYLAEKEKKD